jgi:hypothetical protein
MLLLFINLLIKSKSSNKIVIQLQLKIRNQKLETIIIL